jgi:hypothetical protein
VIQGIFIGRMCGWERWARLASHSKIPGNTLSGGSAGRWAELILAVSGENWSGALRHHGIGWSAVRSPSGRSPLATVIPCCVMAKKQ